MSMTVEKECDSLEMKRHSLEKTIFDIWIFLEEFVPLMNTHGAEFISGDHWDKHLPGLVGQTLMSLSDDELCCLPLGALHRLEKETELSEVKTEHLNVYNNEWLNSFLSSAKTFHMENTDLLEPLDRIINGKKQTEKDVHHTDLFEKQNLISEAMCQKKRHEVGWMAEVVSVLHKSLEADVVIDIGSGKGYLSCELARCNKLPVLGLDSRSVNTQSASQRDSRLGRRWEGLARRQEGGHKKKQSKSKASRKQLSETTSAKVGAASLLNSSPTDVENEETIISLFDEKLNMSRDNSESNITVSNCDGCNKNTCQPKVSTEVNSQKRCSNSLDNLGVDKGSESNVSNEMYNHKGTDCFQAPNKNNFENVKVNLSANELSLDSQKELSSSQERRERNTKKDDPGLHVKVDLSANELSLDSQKVFSSPQERREGITKKDDPGLYVPITMFVRPDMDVRDVIRNHAPHLCDDSSKARLLIAGLHTCGSLAVTSMQLFLQDPGAVGLCSVGCCYHAMDEVSDVTDSTAAHFPLSNFARSKNLHLGRNARNLASQAVHRIHASQQLQGKDFFWRALLDVLIHDLDLPAPDRIQGMRGMVKKCGSFADYAYGAFKKLGFSTEQLSALDLHAMETKHGLDKQRLTAFFQLKLALAPAIETLILADRCLYLLNQECVSEAHIVRLFDPVTSPRCCAIIARKKRNRN